ncbi:translation initiation factor IF-2-like [Schistocerca cancellata]|uniref:translation initiation factor IF-2-like n=1 Tax=Schistocerca cancellata TaxID=274614 RepID=UPI002117B8EC|nr:translation initiation factor IF-2-like [Schistocerca cancellata]
MNWAAVALGAPPPAARRVDIPADMDASPATVPETMQIDSGSVMLNAVALTETDARATTPVTGPEPAPAVAALAAVEPLLELVSETTPTPTVSHSVVAVDQSVSLENVDRAVFVPPAQVTEVSRVVTASRAHVDTAPPLDRQDSSSSVGASVRSRSDPDNDRRDRSRSSSTDSRRSSTRRERSPSPVRRPLSQGKPKRQRRKGGQRGSAEVRPGAAAHVTRSAVGARADGSGAGGGQAAGSEAHRAEVVRHLQSVIHQSDALPPSESVPQPAVKDTPPVTSVRPVTQDAVVAQSRSDLSTMSVAGASPPVTRPGAWGDEPPDD